MAEFKQFMALNGFIYGFKKRNRFNSRRSHFKRRSPPSPQVDASFLAEMCELFESENPDFILNCDETAWKLYLNGILTWADRGSDDIALNVTGNKKTVSGSWPEFLFHG
jgi:hypothetical protein